MKSGPVVYQFWDRRFRRHDCGLCWALVARNSAQAHARHHFDRGELPGEPNRDSYLAVLEVTVEPDGRAHQTGHGCWQLAMVG